MVPKTRTTAYGILLAVLTAITWGQGNPAGKATESISWPELCELVKSDPDNDLAVAQFLYRFRQFQRQGAVDIGKTPKQVRAQLGDVHQGFAEETLEGGKATRQKLVYGFLVLDFTNNQLWRVLDPRGVSAEMTMAVQGVRFRGDDRKWAPGLRVVNRRSDFTNLFLPDESSSHWTEKQVVENFFEFAVESRTIQDALKSLQTQYREEAWKTDWKIIADQGVRLLYEARTSASDGQPGFVEVGQLILGTKDVHRYAYIAKIDNSSQEKLRLWRDIVGSAELYDKSADPVAARRFFDEAMRISATNVRRQRPRVIRLLQQATFLDSQQPLYHFELSRVFSRTEDLFRAWVELRKTVILAPYHAEGAARFEKIWQDAVDQGVLNVGAPLEELRARFGRPDDTKESRTGAEWTYGFMTVKFVGQRVASWVDVRGLTTGTFTSDTITHQLDFTQWEIKQRFADRLSETAIYDERMPTLKTVPATISMHRLVDGRKKMDVKAFYRSLETYAKMRDPSRVFHLIQDSTNDILYETWVPQAGQREVRHQLTRIVSGQRDIHQFNYLASAAKMSPDDRTRWLRWLHSITITPSPQAAASPVSAEVLLRHTAWELGSAIAFTSLSPILKAPPERSEAALRQAQKLADRFGVTLEKSPKLSGKLAADAQTMSDYLDRASASITKNMNEDQTALFHLSRSVTVLLVKYHPDGKNNRLFIDELTSLSTQLGIPQSTWQGVITKLHVGAPAAEVRRGLTQLKDTLDRQLFPK